MLDLLAIFIGGLFATNAIPHFVNGVMGRDFPSPFAKPPGRGLSPPTVNVVWGFANAVAAYLLIYVMGDVNWHMASNALAFGAGILIAGLGLAGFFGKR